MLVKKKRKCLYEQIDAQKKKINEIVKSQNYFDVRNPEWIKLTLLQKELSDKARGIIEELDL